MSVTIAKIATGEMEDTAYVSPNRRKSGKAGAEARAESMSAMARSQVAKKAANVRWRKGEKDMTGECAASLHALMSEGGRELQNIEFLAGASPDKEGMCAEAERAIRSAIDRGMPHEPPVTGRAKVKL